MTAGIATSVQTGRIVRPVDFARVLATPMRLRSPHFALHHLAGRPQPIWPRPAAGRSPAPDTASLSTELSTGSVASTGPDVDDSAVELTSAAGAQALSSAGIRLWLGLVVPKKNAKRAVTRTLLKRQIRNVAAACASELDHGLWVVRLRAPFDPKHFTSAASEALKLAVRDELRALFARAVRGERDAFKPREPRPASGARGGRASRGAAVGSRPAAANPPDAIPPCPA